MIWLSNPKVSTHEMKSRAGGGRLVWRTFIVALVLMSTGLLTSSAVELIFRYRESVENIWILQKEMAQGASFKIQRFMEEIENTMRASTRTKDIVSTPGDEGR